MNCLPYPRSRSHEVTFRPGTNKYKQTCDPSLDRSRLPVATNMSLFCNKSLLRTMPPKLNAEYSKMLRTPVPSVTSHSSQFPELTDQVE